MEHLRHRIRNLRGDVTEGAGPITGERVRRVIDQHLLEQGDPADEARRCTGAGGPKLAQSVKENVEAQRHGKNRAENDCGREYNDQVCPPVGEQRGRQAEGKYEETRTGIRHNHGQDQDSQARCALSRHEFNQKADGKQLGEKRRLEQKHAIRFVER